MLGLIIIVLFALWLLGFFGRRGGLIHLLLVVALVLIVIRVLR